jgi:S-formylglutathione hydrolase FrmB
VSALPDRPNPRGWGRTLLRWAAWVGIGVVVLAVFVAFAIFAGTVSGATGEGARGGPGAPARSGGEPAGIRTLSIRSLEPRLQEATLATATVPGGRTRVRILLPSGYRRDAARGAHGGRRYPVLYLLHGALGDETSYTSQDFGLREHTAKLPLIVVMPDSGTGDGYVDWWNNGRGGPPQWETYHVRQLIPWVDAHYRTVAKREGRAVAGLSMGGDGALKYAAKHPDLFVAAHAFSGAVDLNFLHQFFKPGPAYGPYETQEVRWRGNNAWDLAPNLRDVGLALRTGDGSPGGPYGNGPWPNGVDPVEAGVHVANLNLHARLRALHIPHVWDDYGPGGHTVPYWNRDLRLSLPLLMRTFRHPPARPRPVDFRAIEPRYDVYGWDVRLRRKVLEFSRLSGAGRAGFRLTGSGSATVTTPALYRPAGAYRVTVSSRGRHATVERIQADRAGRLRVALALGPSNRFQEFTPQERATPSRFRTVTVRVRPALEQESDATSNR